MRNKPVHFSGLPTQPFAWLDLLICMTQILKVISTYHTYWCDFWKFILVGYDIQILMMMESKLIETKYGSVEQLQWDFADVYGSTEGKSFHYNFNCLSLRNSYSISCVHVLFFLTCYVRWKMTINQYESYARACFFPLWGGCALKWAGRKLMTYQAQITIAVLQKLYRGKLIKLTATDPGQETGKYAKTIPKIAPFKNAHFFPLLSSLPSPF